MGRRPGSVRVERPAVERAEVDLVELLRDDDRDSSSVGGKRERLLRARKPGGHGDVDLLAGELARKRACLLDALRSQTLTGDRRRSDVVAVRAGEPVPDQQELLHR